MTKAERAVVKAAMAWWEGHRPIGDSLMEHLQHPAVNTQNGREGNLARACAELAKRGKARKPRG